jgi:hypothetical protein
MIRPSRATMSVPTGAPNRITDVKTNVSETERLAGIEGSLTVAEPLKMVNAARISQLFPTDDRASSILEAVIVQAPATITAYTYNLPERERVRGLMRRIPASTDGGSAWLIGWSGPDDYRCHGRSKSL